MVKEAVQNLCTNRASRQPKLTAHVVRLRTQLMTVELQPLPLSTRLTITVFDWRIGRGQYVCPFGTRTSGIISVKTKIRRRRVRPQGRPKHKYASKAALSLN